MHACKSYHLILYQYSNQEAYNYLLRAINLKTLRFLYTAVIHPNHFLSPLRMHLVFCCPADFIGGFIMSLLNAFQWHTESREFILAILLCN